MDRGGKKEKRQGRNPLQCAKHAQLSFDLLQALKGRTFIRSGFSTEWALISVSAVPHCWVAFCACSHRANVMRVMNSEYFFFFFFFLGGGGGGASDLHDDLFCKVDNMFLVLRKKNKPETRMTASVLKQDPNTEKVQKNVIHWDKTQAGCVLSE